MGTIFKKIISLAVAGIFTTALPSLAQASFYLGLGYGEVDYDGINRPFNDLLGSTAHGFHRVTDNFYPGQKYFQIRGGRLH
ncbi:MAG: hypothetical protein GX029_13180 [Pseudomonadaceae bacterium]|nr:hypothetical protein [Pseudomonadaceae bacterium]